MMRNRQKQRELRRAGIRKEQPLEPRNGEHYIDLTPREAVQNILKKSKTKNS